MQIYGWELLAVCHHPDKFGDHRHCESGGRCLICHVTSYVHMFKGLCYFMGGSLSLVKSPPCHVGGCWSLESGDIKYLICHVTSQNLVIEGSSNFMKGNSSLYVTILPSLVAIGIVMVEMFLVYHVI